MKNKIFSSITCSLIALTAQQTLGMHPDFKKYVASTLVEQTKTTYYIKKDAPLIEVRKCLKEAINNQPSTGQVVISTTLNNDRNIEAITIEKPITLQNLAKRSINPASLTLMQALNIEEEDAYQQDNKIARVTSSNPFKVTYTNRCNAKL